ncbi:transposase [Streptomyces sp. 900105245]
MRGALTVPAPRKYPLELRERAVRMSRASEPKPVIRRMAEELGVHHEALRNWIRDRARYYAEGADRGASTALQVADRFHLWKNLEEAAERLVRRLRSQWAPPAPEKPEANAERSEGLRAQRTRERHAAVHALMDKGLRHSDIVRRTRPGPQDRP